MEGLDPIEVRRYGAGEPTVVVLHGGPGAPGSAAGLARLLSRDFAVLEPLQRRAGRVPLTVSRHVEDLAAVAPQPAVLIGWSWGAMLGLSFAARYPHAVSDLVLVGCGTYDESSRALFRSFLDRRLSPTERRHIDVLRRRLAAESDPARQDALFGELGTAYLRAESFDLLEDAEGPEAPLSTDAAGHLETWEDVLRLQDEGVEPAAFRAITARVVMIHGDVDPHPGPETRDLLRRFIPHLDYAELPRCGHEPWNERHARDRFAELVRDRLRRR